MNRAAFLFLALAIGASAQVPTNPPNIGPITTTLQDEIGTNTAPAVPATGKCRRYFNLATGLETWINSLGGSCASAGGPGQIASTTGLQSIPPALNVITISNDPTNTCAYPVNILTNGQAAIWALSNGTICFNFGFGGVQAFTIRPPIGTIANGSSPQWVASRSDFEILPPLAFSGIGGSSPQIGDTLRYNVNADNQFDSVSYAQQVIALYAVQDGVLVQGNGGGSTLLGSGTNIFPTNTVGWSRQLSASASASTNTVVGAVCCVNGNNVLLPLRAFYRFGEKLQLSTATNARWWIGLANYNVGSSLGINNAQITGTTAYAQDIPNKSTIAFRFSAGTDTTWQAVCITPGVSATSTIVSTGVSFDSTAPHLFEIIPDVLGATMNFFIDGVSVASISTNCPATNLTFDSEAGMFFTGDNKNTATAISSTFFWAAMVTKP